MVATKDAAKAATTIAIEIDGPQNERLFFLPTQDRVRGRFDYLRVAEPSAKNRLSAFNKDGIPGQRIEVDLESKTGRIVESLRDPSHTFIREHIEKNYRCRVAETQEHQDIDVTTWLYWMQRAVDSGLAKVVAGQFPEVLEGEPKRSFFSPKRVRPEAKAEAIYAKMTDAMERMADSQAQLGEVLATVLAKLASK